MTEDPLASVTTDFEVTGQEDKVEAAKTETVVVKDSKETLLLNEGLSSSPSAWFRALVGHLFLVEEMESNHDDHCTIAQNILEHVAQGSGKLLQVYSVFSSSYFTRGHEPYGVRLLNPRLLAYACYEWADGSVMGDPRMLQFTRVGAFIDASVEYSGDCHPLLCFHC